MSETLNDAYVVSERKRLIISKVLTALIVWLPKLLELVADIVTN